MIREFKILIKMVIFTIAVCIIILIRNTDTKEIKKTIRNEPIAKAVVTDSIDRTNDRVIPYTDLIRAIIHVESRGRDKVVNHKSQAVGCLQIRPVMVREVNRILTIIGSNRSFSLLDRFDRRQSIKMFNIWKQFHHMDDSDEVVARCWNGGTKGATMSGTTRYWNKVQRTLDSYTEKR